MQHHLPFSVAIRSTRLNKQGTAIEQHTAFGIVMTPTSHLIGSTKNTTPSPTPLSIPQTMPLIDNEDMSTAKYLKQVLIASPSSLEESEIEVLQEMISVLKKDLSAAWAEIAALRLNLTNAKSYGNTLESHIELEYLISSQQKSGICVFSFDGTAVLVGTQNFHRVVFYFILNYKGLQKTISVWKS
ncbi:hypothetical protein QYM36_016242 [Artemia franciscana]|uniref:Uncharacterized protein n=1 Tax=Artemia franciscana TaxID=6661 RepID=A0AA88H9H7_ARTSF|nr:hypothetical protein QYM36_016242 [Artemia franciscana]